LELALLWYGIYVRKISRNWRASFWVSHVLSSLVLQIQFVVFAMLHRIRWSWWRKSSGSCQHIGFIIVLLFLNPCIYCGSSYWFWSLNWSLIREKHTSHNLFGGLSHSFLTWLVHYLRSCHNLAFPWYLSLQCISILLISFVLVDTFLTVFLIESIDDHKITIMGLNKSGDFGFV
jgi:hypothetical protein